MSTTNNSASPGFLGLLTLLFIGLKLGSVIAWSWWWVLSPLLAPLGIAAFFGAMWLVLRAFESKEKRNARKLREALEGLQRRYGKP